MDWEDSCALRRVCSGIDLVVHSAGIGAKECETSPVAALEFNGLATARLIEESVNAGVQSFLYLSTVHVYADPLAGCITEASCARNPHPYATSHLAGENALLYYALKGRIGGGILRLSNCFGVPALPNIDCWALFCNDICMQAVTENRIKITSDGGVQRIFIPIGRMVRAITALGSLDNTRKKAFLGVVNLGLGESRSLYETASLVKTRCEQRLGRSPDLICDVNKHTPRFSYESLNPNALYFNASHFNDEIDSLIGYINGSKGN
jgi:UDP-glucose 4-epimerase